MAKKRGNGEGSITKYKDGRWCGRYTIQTAEGRKRKAIYGKTRVEVSSKLKRILADQDRGLVISDSSEKLGEFLNRWLRDCEKPSVDARHMTYGTYIRYEGIVRNHLAPALGHRKLKDLTRTEVRKRIGPKFRGPPG